MVASARVRQLLTEVRKLSEEERGELEAELISLGADQPEAPHRKLTVDEFLASSLRRPEGVAPVTLEDIESAIREGALGRAVP
jgi:hypothetical protein